jgi:quinol-cytochrome oxidoreductase complex cytochrome b subunit
VGSADGGPLGRAVSGFVARLALGVAIMGALLWVVYCGATQTIYALRCDWLCGPPAAPALDDPLLTPPQIVPEWYTLPSYGMLRAITFGIGPLDAKWLGLIVAAAAFIAPLTLAFFNWSKTPARAFIPLIALPFVIGGLGYCAVQSGIHLNPWPLQILTAAYFAIFAAFPLLARRH